MTTQHIEIAEMQFDAEEHVANWYVLVTDGASVRYLHNDGSLHSEASDTPHSTGWYASEAEAMAAVAAYKSSR